LILQSRVQICQRRFQHLAMARVRGSFKLLKNALSRKQQTLAALLSRRLLGSEWNAACLGGRGLLLLLLY